MTTEQATYLAEILAFTQKQIKTATGISVTLRVVSLELPNANDLHPKDMLDAMLQAVGITYEDLIKKSRKSEMVSTRHACAYILNAHFPKMGPLRIGQLFHQDHTSIIYALNKAGDKLDDLEPEFMLIYTRAEAAASRWLTNAKEVDDV